MLMNIVVKIPQELILKSAEKVKEIPCLRLNCQFNQYDDFTWKDVYSCGGYGNGYGVGFSCKEDCSLRINDKSKCVVVSPKRYDSEYSFLVQPEFYKNDEESL